MSRMDKIKKALCTRGLDAILITGEPNRLYATGFPSTDGMAVITQDAGYFFTDSRYIEAAENAINDMTVLMVSSGNSYYDRINAVIADHGIKTLGFEEEETPYAAYSRLCEKLNAQLVPAQELLTELRSVKSEDEMEKMRAAEAISEKTFLEILGLITTDVTEKELAAEMTYRMILNGADDKSFDPIIVSAAKSSMPHGVPGDVKIQKGFLTLDFGARKDGYCSDTTRTVCVGKPTDEMRDIYNIVLEAQLAGIEAARAGVPGCDIDGAARKVIADAGYGEYFGHSFGHSLGIEIHEAPNAAPSNKLPMPAGAVISAEPGIYLPGKFGVRIEDVIHLNEKGNVNLTGLAKELLII